MLYSSEHYATALLEKLAHFNGVLPGNQHYIRITIPPGISYEEFQPAAHSGWDGIDDSFSNAFGPICHLYLPSSLLFLPSFPVALFSLFLFSHFLSPFPFPLLLSLFLLFFLFLFFLFFSFF